MKIVCFHLYNDYSGSPKVLHGVISGLLDRGYSVDLVTSRGGVLDTLSHPSLSVTHYNYRFSDRAVLTMLRYLGAQILTFFIALRYAFRRDTLFYINTILPVGPAIAGKLTGRRVVYHYHENATVKSGFYRALATLMQWIADAIICVSGYQASFLKREKNIVVIPNTLEASFLQRLHPNPAAAFERKTVLMLSSLKAYKGTKEFLNIAAALPQFRFVLVINDTESAISGWLSAEMMTPASNVTLLPRTDNVAALYNDASIVLNLSNPSLVIETFGLTALEAMACALPVIVPTVGGIAEMVDDGVNGYKTDCRDTEMLIARITRLLTDKYLYLQLSHNAYSTSLRFNRERMLDLLTDLLK